MTVAVLIATAESGADQAATPSAALPFRAGMVLEHLRDQLASLGVRKQYVVVRPRHAPLLRRLRGVEVQESLAVAEDLRFVARAARAAGEPVAVLPADLVCHRAVLSNLLADPRVSAGALVSANAVAPAPVLRIEHQRIVSAGSAYHRVSGANAAFLGAVRAGADDTETLAGVAERLAPLAGREQLDDVPALLLVGLVRAGRQVSAVDVRVLQCRRITDMGQAATADAAMRAINEDRVLLDSAVKADDGFFTTYFVSPYTKHLARWAARRGLTPNTVTVVSLGMGAVAAACFALGDRAGLVAGAVLVQLAFAADCVDGQLARYTRRFSAFGGWLDTMSDRAKEYAVYAGLAVGATATGAGGVWVLAVAALGLQSVRHMIDFGYAGAHPQVVDALPRRPLEEPGDGLDGHVVPGVQGGQRALPAGSAASYALGAGATRLSSRLERRSVTRWLKKIVVLPIGERFALISVTAAIFNARITFIALLAWGSVAAAYALAGRVLRSLARPPRAAPGRSASGMPATARGRTP